MANFTQLHIENPQDPKKTQNTKNSLSKEKALFGAGLIAVTAVSGVFLLITNGCSKGSSKAPSAISAPAPVSPEVTSPTPVAAAVQTVVAPKPSKKRVQHKAPMSTFTDPANGVSFKYPKSYILKTGDEPQQMDLAGLGQLKTNYVQPGGVTVAAINQESRLKYFHHFENGNCYEFSMGLGTTDATVAGLKPVNHSLVFGRMEQMLASVHLQPVAVPEVAKDSSVHVIVEGGKE